MAPPPPPNTLVLALTGSTSQKPLKKNVGLKVTLSCPLESCSVAVKGTITIPSTRRGGKATTYNLKSSTVRVTAGKRATVTFKLSKTRRSQVASRLQRALTRTKVSARITATATDVQGLKVVKNLTIKVRR